MTVIDRVLSIFVLFKVVSVIATTTISLTTIIVLTTTTVPVMTVLTASALTTTALTVVVAISAGHSPRRKVASKTTVVRTTIRASGNRTEELKQRMMAIEFFPRKQANAIN
jgi:hypothetical protein